MKQLVIGVTLMAVGACNQSAPPAAVTVANAPTAVAKPASAKALPPIAKADTLTPEMLQLLRQYDFAPLWSGQRLDDFSPVMDGFFGQDYRRIAFVFTAITRDSVQPQLFHVRGKNKFQKEITPFSGEITVSSLSDLPDHAFLDMDSAATQAYTATARFSFCEERANAHAGEFVGLGYLDFFFDGEGELRIAQTAVKPDATAPARGAGVVFRGQWKAYRSALSRPLVLSNNAFMVAPELLPQFGIGERGGQINPKYAKLGWNEVMENDEWWDKPTKPTLSL